MTNCPSTPKPFRADGGDISTGRLKEIADNPYGDEEKCWLAKRVLASLDLEPVAWTDTDELRDVKNGGNGYLFAIGGEANKFADPRRQVMLYTTPPAQMLEIENLEHFISFWKKVQAGQMKPGKNDIDHTVWFLEGLSNSTTPPAPANAEPVAWLWSHRKHPSEVSLVRPEDDERAEGAHWSGWSCQALYAAPQQEVK